MELKEIAAGHGRRESDAHDCAFAPLLDWEDVMRDEREDSLGFARRATLALLTQSGAGLFAGFGGGQPEGAGRDQEDCGAVPRAPAAAGLVCGRGGEAVGACG